MLDVDAVLVNHGYSNNYEALAELGFTIVEGAIHVSEQAETNVPGIFAAGDCASYSSKVRLIAGSFNDAILAINSAKRYLDPDAPYMAYVSSHNDIFKEMNKRILTN